jgi:hypothetical protein
MSTAFNVLIALIAAINLPLIVSLMLASAGFDRA